MCELCSTDEETRKRAQSRCLRTADQLERLARYYRDSASHKVKQHTPEVINRVGPLARSLIRELVEEWV